MKATLKADGTLYIEAETELEQYALMQWAGDNMKPGTATKNLKVSWANRPQMPMPVMRPQVGRCIVCMQTHGLGTPCPTMAPQAY